MFPPQLHDLGVRILTDQRDELNNRIFLVKSEFDQDFNDWLKQYQPERRMKFVEKWDRSLHPDGNSTYNGSWSFRMCELKGVVQHVERTKANLQVLNMSLKEVKDLLTTCKGDQQRHILFAKDFSSLSVEHSSPVIYHWLWARNKQAIKFDPLRQQVEKIEQIWPGFKISNVSERNCIQVVFSLKPLFYL